MKGRKTTFQTKSSFRSKNGNGFREIAVEDDGGMVREDECRVRGENLSRSLL